jgi:hypothetical protein
LSILSSQEEEEEEESFWLKEVSDAGPQIAISNASQKAKKDCWAQRN